MSSTAISFNDTLGLMRAHWTRGETTAFPIHAYVATPRRMGASFASVAGFDAGAARADTGAANFTSDAGAAHAANGVAETKELTDQCQREFNAVGEAQKKGVEEAASALQADRSAQGVSSFKSRMEALRQKAIKDATESINKAYDKAEQLGQNKPSFVQEALLKGMMLAQDLLTKAFQKVFDLVADLVGKVIGWISDALGGILGKIGDAFSSVLGSIF